MDTTKQYHSRLRKDGIFRMGNILLDERTADLNPWELVAKKNGRCGAGPMALR